MSEERVRRIEKEGSNEDLETKIRNIEVFGGNRV